MECELVIAFELHRDPLREVTVGVEPCHFVLILDRQKLEIIASHGFSECAAARQFRGLGDTYFRYKVGVTLGIRDILVRGEEIVTARNELIDRLGQLL